MQRLKANQKAPVASADRELVRVRTLYVFCLQSLFTGDDVEDDLIAFIERSEAVALNSTIMDEYVLAGFLRNETEAMFVIEPFNFATGHSSFFSWLSRAGQTIKKTQRNIPLCTITSGAAYASSMRAT